MVKKAKLKPVAWLTNVIFLLQRGELSTDEVFEMTNTARSELCESLLYEHPSIHVAHNRVSWLPFTSINGQEELLALLRSHAPIGIRRIDLRGLYPFVDADLDELLFNGQAIQLDDRQDSYTVRTEYMPILESVQTLFRDAVSA
tara:strand:+ start:1443 stop:1874 length:432 start_codon:yes stop_codon:yes gene_type:complete